MEDHRLGGYPVLPQLEELAMWLEHIQTTGKSWDGSDMEMLDLAMKHGLTEPVLRRQVALGFENPRAHIVAHH